MAVVPGAFDTAINHGSVRAKRIHARQLSEIELYQAKRMLDYITYETWPHHGVAWETGCATFAGSEKA